MSGNSIEISPGIFRASNGRYLEDFEVGHVYEHRPGRTISEADNTWFTLLTMNQHPIHFDAEYARHSEFGKTIVNSALTLSIVVGMSVSDVSQKAIANLGWTDIVMPNPVYPGDTLYAETEVLAKRESRSRPTQGIVSVDTRAFNQHGDKVMLYLRIFKNRALILLIHTHPESSSAAVISDAGVFAGYRGINIRLFTSAINVRESEMQVVEVRYYR